MSCLPSGLAMLVFDESVSVVVVAGCGGGMDFVHSALFLPHLYKKKKKVIILSNSFGPIDEVCCAVFDTRWPLVKLVNAATVTSGSYCPETSMCGFLDSKYPDEAPHEIYAANARDFTVGVLADLLSWIVSQHAVDAIVLVDGGSDSLMKVNGTWLLIPKI